MEGTRAMLDLREIYPDQLREPCLINAVYEQAQAVKPGGAFVALKGEKTDGHQYLKQAFGNGASVAIVEQKYPTIKGLQIVVPDTYRALSTISAKLYPLARPMRFIGITGTDGKTSAAVFLQKLLTALGKSVGYIGTNGAAFGDTFRQFKGTTPLAPALFPLLAQMSRQGVEVVVMEVSSHALVTKRVIDIAFDYAVFTNFSQDHLDYHKTLEAYKAAKLLLFQQLNKAGKAVVNVDDAISLDVMAAVETRQIMTYGMENEAADFFAQNIGFIPDGMKFVLHHAGETFGVRTKLLGAFNVYNVLVSIAIAQDFGYDLPMIITCVKNIPPVEGRMELFYHQKRQFSAIVDFAHAPSAIKNVLQVARKIAKGLVIVVTGAVGEGDRGKRPRMAQTAVAYADVVIFTTDQPYSEDPQAIIGEMIAELDISSYRVILDRQEAITKALDQAQAGDVVVILGKGRETEIQYKDKVIPFSDYEFVKRYMSKEH